MIPTGPCLNILIYLTDAAAHTHDGSILCCLQGVTYDMSRCLVETCFYFLFLGQLMASCHGYVNRTSQLQLQFLSS